jgi:metal-responsive CopG/Arc/MetJ family transcriptional regulator
MSTKQRSAEQTAISLSLPKQLLTQIDDRAAALGLNRSQYLSVLARNDLAKRPALRLVETYPTSPEEAVAEQEAEAIRAHVRRSTQHTHIITASREAAAKRKARQTRKAATPR